MNRASTSSAYRDQYDTLPPNAILKPSRFKVYIPDSQLSEFKKHLEISKFGPHTYENLSGDRKYGMNYKWLKDAKAYWETKYDWRATEGQINSFVQYEVPIPDDTGENFAIHFTGLFSENPDAIPIVLLHGWPGSFLEFLKILHRLRGKYSPEDLPYHVVVPSLPGYGFSTGPPTTREWVCEDIALMIHRLMIGLGFEDGYVAHGGDIGSMVARIMAAQFDACKALHVNFNIMHKPEGASMDALTAVEKQGLERANYFFTQGNAYAREHGQRPATIGFVLSTSPLALLAWIGEKFLEWTDIDPSLESILDSVTLYWLTQTFPRAIYPYAQFHGDGPRQSIIHPDPRFHCSKPMGYSYFPKEIAPMPVSWVKTTGNVVWHRTHTEGGHFAAMERPDLLLADIEEFIEQLK